MLYEVSPEFKLITACFMFMSGISAFTLCIFKLVNRRKIRSILPSVAVFVLSVLISAYLTAASRPNFTASHSLINLPAALPLPIGAAVMIGSVAGIIGERRRSRETLSSDSVRQAFNDLNTGIFFSNPDGRIVLINHTMLRLVNELFDGSLQSYGDFYAALNKKGSLLTDSGSKLYRFSDSRVWKIDSVNLTHEGLKGFIQTTALDVTDIYSANEKLNRENETLRQTNIKMQQMYDRLADRIRDEETLKLKRKIHDNIGASLIALTGILGGDASEETDSRLNELEDAISYLVNDRRDTDFRFGSAVSQAKELRVELKLDGELPDDASLERIITLAARECVINCVNHAGGSIVICHTEKTENHFIVSFTNNGKVPSAPIREGGGLTALRRAVEDAGGEMRISHTPVFMLTLEFHKEIMT